MMKYCAMCNIEKPYEQFNKANRKYGDGYNSYCRACASHYYFSRKSLTAKRHKVIEQKECKTCRQIKPVSEFGRMKSTDDGFNEHCSKCWRRMILKAR